MFQHGLLAARPAAAADLLLVINQVLTDGFPEVAVYFTFTDAAGVPITDVSKDRVQAIHNGKAVPEFSLDLAESEQDGLSVVVAVDTSGSMQGQPLEYARSAVRQALEKMGPRDKGAIVSFGQTSQVVQELTGDREALNRALDSLQAKGDTALYDGVFEAVSLVAKQPLGRRAVIVISDGEDTHSTLKLDDVINRARDTSTPISAIAIGNFQLEPLLRMTQTTGGTLGEVPSPERLAERATQLSELLRKQYVLRYRAPDTRPPENEVEVAVSQAGQQVRVSQRFPAPPMPLAITLPALQAGQTVSGSVELQPTLANTERVDTVEYLLDGASLGTVTEPPYRFTWNTGGVPAGEHTLTIRARLGEQIAEQDVPLVVAAAQIASPSPVAAGLPAAGASPGAAAAGQASGTPVATATPSAGATRTPTAAPADESTEKGWLGGVSPLVLIGLAIVAALIGGIIFAASRQSRRIAAASGTTPDTTPLPPGLLPGQPAPYEPITYEAQTVDRPTSDHPMVDHPTSDSSTIDYRAPHDIREAQTEMVERPATSAGAAARPPGPCQPDGACARRARPVLAARARPDHRAIGRPGGDRGARPAGVAPARPPLLGRGPLRVSRLRSDESDSP